jgi:hypothetical protein
MGTFGMGEYLRKMVNVNWRGGNGGKWEVKGSRLKGSFCAELVVGNEVLSYLYGRESI